MTDNAPATDESAFSKRLSALNKLLIDLSQCTTCDALCRRAVECARDGLCFERVGVWLTTDEPGVIRGTFGIDEKGGLRDERASRLTVQDDSLMGRILTGHLPFYKREEGPLYDAQAQVVGAGSHAVVPLWDGKRIYGMVSIDNALAGKPLSEEDCELLGLLASSLGALLTRQMAEEERLKLDARVQHAQKLESLGVLAGGIAHDFNNLLVGILGHSDLALMDLPEDSPVRNDIESIKSAARRASELTNQMLAYSGRGRFVAGLHDINRIIREMAHLLEVSVSKKTELKLTFGENLPDIKADASQVRQVVMNLVTNAAEAIGDSRKGVVSVRTALRSVAGNEVRSVVPGEMLSRGYYVILEVVDTGCGIAEDSRQRLFEPFFTTKFAGRGLGLAAVQGIVRGHRGAIDVASERGSGSTFRVYLPCVPGRAPADSEGRTTDGGSALDNVKGTVLVVDDEENMRHVAELLLSRRGFSVLSAGNGRHGLEVFQRHAEDISLVVLDMTMPEMDGPETYKAIREIDPDVPIVLTSGYDEDDARRRFGDGKLAGFIQKPFQVEAMLSVVRRAIAASDGASDAEQPGATTV
jgi:two-component system, cell cycle sensor histidine kinase and response regulator CckA